MSLLVCMGWCFCLYVSEFIFIFVSRYVFCMHLWVCIFACIFAFSCLLGLVSFLAYKDLFDGFSCLDLCLSFHVWVCACEFWFVSLLVCVCACDFACMSGFVSL